jgi:hypothetical protein
VEAITETPVAIIPLNAKLLLFNSHLLPSNKTKTKQKKLSNKEKHIHKLCIRKSEYKRVTNGDREGMKVKQ